MDGMTVPDTSRNRGQDRDAHRSPRRCSAPLHTTGAAPPTASAPASSRASVEDLARLAEKTLVASAKVRPKNNDNRSHADDAWRDQHVGPRGLDETSASGSAPCKSNFYRAVVLGAIWT